MNATLLSITLALALFFGMNTQRRDVPAPEPGPRIAFDTLVHDLGELPFAGDGHCSFRFTNTGDAPLIIQSFQSSCGCLVPYYDLEPVPPGGTGSVRLKYDTYRAGPFRKSATLYTNAVNEPVLVLRIKGRVLPREEPPAKP